MGSAKFKKLVDAYKWDEAMEVCLAQCEKRLTFCILCRLRPDWRPVSHGQVHETLRD